VTFDSIEIDGLGDSGHRVEVFQIPLEVRIIDDPAQIVPKGPGPRGYPTLAAST